MRAFLHRCKIDKPWDWAGLACICMAAGFATMTDFGGWRIFEYAAAACGLVAIGLAHEVPVDPPPPDAPES
jgi:hypothetical protein